MMKKNWRTVMALTTMAALVLTGCGGADGTQEASGELNLYMAFG